MKTIGSTYRSRVVNVTLEGRAVSMDNEGGEETDAATAGRNQATKQAFEKWIHLSAMTRKKHRHSSCGSTG